MFTLQKELRAKDRRAGLNDERAVTELDLLADTFPNLNRAENLCPTLARVEVRQGEDKKRIVSAPARRKQIF